MYIHIIEYYPAIKWNEILIHVITWMNLKNITLGGRNQQKTML